VPHVAAATASHQVVKWKPAGVWTDRPKPSSLASSMLRLSSAHTHVQQATAKCVDEQTADTHDTGLLCAHGGEALESGG